MVDDSRSAYIGITRKQIFKYRAVPCGVVGAASESGKINYPYLKSNPSFELAKKQMKQGGGLISVQLKAKDIATVEVFCNSLKTFLLATSWGARITLFPNLRVDSVRKFFKSAPL